MSGGREAFEAWKAERRQSVASPLGELALVSMRAIDAPTRIDGVPGEWAPSSSGEPGLTLTATADEGVEVDGKPLDGAATLEAEHSLVRWAASPTKTAIATSQPGSNHLLTIYDAQAEAIGRFEGIDAFDYDESWVVEATFVAGEAARKVGFSHVSDAEGSVRHHESPGDVAFEKDGATYALSPFDAGGGALIVIFADRTNGVSTYGMGRMIVVERKEDGQVTLDFNRAFLPSCAFSPNFNCPLPPRNNRLPFAIEAGEREVVWKA